MKIRVLPVVALFLTILACTTAQAQTLGAGDISLRPGASATLAGSWTKTADATAAGGSAVWYPNAGAAKVTTAVAAPSSYFEISFDAEAGIPYRLWIRLRAQNNDPLNDSVFVQFSGSVDDTSAPIYRIGTTSAAEVNLEECKGCGISGWGWQDNGWGVGVLGPTISFATAGTQKLRVQSREDGAIIDQILLSPAKYISSSPGALKNDTTILPATGGSGSPFTMVRGPYVQQVGATAATVVWATRESGTGVVTVTGATGGSGSFTAASRRVTAATSGLSYDYYQHEARLTGLAPATVQTYDLSMSGVDVLPGTVAFRTAPSKGTGSVTFVAFGDSGVGSTAQRSLSDLIGADRFDIALHLGDIAYGNTSGTGDASYTTYQQWFFDIYKSWLGGHGFFPVEGNHDSRPTNNDGAAYLDLFSLPRNGATASYPDHAERFYSYDYGPVHFVALDTEFAFQDVTRRAEQVAWLDADLAATAQPWKIVYFHRSPYSAGGEHGSDTEVRAAFGPLFERYGVQLVLSAHEHDYERTKPWREGTTGSPVTYIVSGGGGGPLYASGTGAWTAYSASRYHYMRVTADTCSLDVEAVGLSGTVFDSTSLSRCTTTAPDVVLYASQASTVAGAWRVEADTTAAGGQRIRHPNAGAAKITTASAAPANYFEQTFNAEAGVPYRLWIRGKADQNYWGNDSVFVQFSGSVTASGSATTRIGTTSANEVNIEDCSGCGLSGWGWQDNGYGSGVLGPVIYFATSGPQTIRIQTREDGLAIDQVVLSPGRFLSKSPGALKNDTTIIQP